MLLRSNRWILRSRSPSYAWVLQVGRSVLCGPARELLDNPDVQRIYLGVG